jgi:hypothetical protein
MGFRIYNQNIEKIEQIYTSIYDLSKIWLNIIMDDFKQHHKDGKKL